MSNELRQLAKDEAEKLFKAYDQLEEVIITSDLQGFTEIEKAENHTAILVDKTTYTFNREDIFDSIALENVQLLGDTGNVTAEIPVEDLTVNSHELETGKDDAQTTATEVVSGENTVDNSQIVEINQDDAQKDDAQTATLQTEEELRASLLAKHLELFGTNAPHNIGTQTLQNKIDEHLKTQA